VLLQDLKERHLLGVGERRLIGVVLVESPCDILRERALVGKYKVGVRAQLLMGSKGIRIIIFEGDD
jgi:hypothetical protein